MFHASRVAARRAASRSSSSSSGGFNAAAATAQSSLAAVALLLVAVVSGERQHNENDTENSALCQEVGGSYTRSDKSSSSSSRPQHHQQSRYINFVATSASSTAQCEHSSASSYHSGLMPDHDLRLRRAVTSKRMAMEKSRRTFFSRYEVAFDDPLGSGKLFSVLISHMFPLV